MSANILRNEFAKIATDEVVDGIIKIIDKEYVINTKSADKYIGEVLDRSDINEKKIYDMGRSIEQYEYLVRDLETENKVLRRKLKAAKKAKKAKKAAKKLEIKTAQKAFDLEMKSEKQA